MKRTLIVFHSRTGHTKRVAQALARRLDADLDEIRIVQPLDGIAGYAMCAIEAVAGLTPALRPMRHDPAAYELVVIGAPVWFWSLASPVRSWLEAQLLRRRVTNRPQKRPGACGVRRVAGGLRRRLRRHRLRQAKVDQENLPVRTDLHIGWLDVAVDDIPAVQVVECV